VHVGALLAAGFVSEWVVMVVVMGAGPRKCWGPASSPSEDWHKAEAINQRASEYISKCTDLKMK
jgi:hypothetical protein